MSGVELIKVKSQDDGMRLNRWFLKYYPALSLGHFQKLLRTKQIKVDGKRAEAGLKLAAGQEVRVPPLNLDEGLAVQGGTNTTRHIDGMLGALKFEYEEAPKLVHRIDKDTSGILVLARDRKNAELLTKAFRERDLHKTYLALVRNCPAKEKGEIKANLEKAGEKSVICEDGKKARHFR